MAKLRAMTLSMRVALIATIFLLPLALLAYFAVIEKEELISFARKEVEGTRAIQPAHSLLAQLKAERISPADSGKDFRTFAATLGLDAQASTSLAAIAEAHDGESLVAAAESLSDFIGAAADRSNLSLDPDMDSYYLMNALVIDVPSMMVKAAAIRSLARRHGASASDMPVELAIALASFKAAQAGFSASFAKAAAGNADGSLTARLTAPKDALLGAAAGLVDFSSGSNDRTALAAAADRVLENAPAFLDAGLRELERLLQDRIDGFYSVLWTRLAAVLVLVLLGGIFSFITARSFVGPVAEITKAMNRLADGDLSTRIPAVDRQDEIGSIARAVEIFKRSMITARDLAAKEADQVKMREARAARVDALVKEFDASAKAVVGTVTTAAAQLQDASTTMSTTAEETLRQSTAVAAASEQASTNVQTVASATEELSASVQEIGRQVAESAKIATKAV